MTVLVCGNAYVHTYSVYGPVQHVCIHTHAPYISMVLNHHLHVLYQGQSHKDFLTVQVFNVFWISFVCLLSC